MRITHYKQDLTSDGEGNLFGFYSIFCTDDLSDFSYCDMEPMTARLGTMTMRASTSYDTLSAAVEGHLHPVNSAIDPANAPSEEEDPDGRQAYLEFCHCYKEVLDGTNHDFRLVGFHVHPNAVDLVYSHRDYALLHLVVVNPDGAIRFNFTAARNAFGVQPTYEVTLSEAEGRASHVCIRENLGLVRRDITVQRKDEGAGLAYENLYMDITEYSNI